MPFPTFEQITAARSLIDRWRRMATGYRQSDNWAKADAFNDAADELEALFPSPVAVPRRIATRSLEL